MARHCRLFARGPCAKLRRSISERSAVTPRETAHYRILRIIENHPETSQRQLAEVLGVSLGKTHYLLAALLEKGLVKVGNFRRSDNKLAYAYLLTPKGIAAKLDLTKAFLRHKEEEFETTRVEIARLKQELGAESDQRPR